MLPSPMPKSNLVKKIVCLSDSSAIVIVLEMRLASAKSTKERIKKMLYIAAMLFVS